MKSVIQRSITLGHHPSDSEDVKLKKSSLLVMSGPFTMAGLVWGLLYFANGLIIPGSIPFCYGVLSVGSVISFSITKKYKFFRNSQLFLILILPFALQISLGGFVPSSAVMYWAIIAPAGAMFFDSIRRSVYWFIAYLLLACTAYLINDFLPGYVSWDLSEDFINALFLMNIIGVSGIVFGILYYFVSTITKLNQNIERKNVELEEQSEKLKEMDKIKSHFFANISHEFRTPLTLILGLVNKQIANHQHPPDLHDSDTMKRNAHRLLQMINQLLDLSKLESGELKLQASKSDIVLFAGNAIAQFESLALTKKIKLTFNGFVVGEEEYFIPEISLYFDKEKLQKILNNLLSNAIKFTPEGGKIEVDIVREAEVVEITVTNTGDEIPPDKLQRIFDRFYQVDASSNRKYEGTGIGLALVKELVDLHHGNVSVESTDGRNSFTVSLPLNPGYLKNEEIREVESMKSDKRKVMSEPERWQPLFQGDTGNANEEVESDGQLEILIVEDNADLRTYIKGILQPGYRIIEAFDGIDGFEKAKESIPDLIVSDIMMPRMDGYELCKKLKSDNKTDHIPVILLTAKATRENKLEGLGTGADDYLVKPFDEAELQVRIKNLISLRQKLQQKFQGEVRLKPNSIKVASVQQKFLEELKEVVEKNMDNELFNVEDLGKAMAMSRSQIHRKLKALTGQSATTFIRNYRLHRAADLLQQGAGNVTEIAFRVGFNSQTYFSSSFNELFGCSPSEYKQRKVQNEA